MAASAIQQRECNELAFYAKILVRMVQKPEQPHTALRQRSVEAHHGVKGRDRLGERHWCPDNINNDHACPQKNRKAWRNFDWRNFSSGRILKEPRGSAPGGKKKNPTAQRPTDPTRSTVHLSPSSFVSFCLLSSSVCLPRYREPAFGRPSAVIAANSCDIVCLNEACAK